MHTLLGISKFPLPVVVGPRNEKTHALTIKVFMRTYMVPSVDFQTLYKQIRISQLHLLLEYHSYIIYHQITKVSHIALFTVYS